MAKSGATGVDQSNLGPAPSQLYSNLVFKTFHIQKDLQMKLLSATMIISMCLLLGCSFPLIRTSWSKPGAQPGEFKRDSIICEQDPGRTGLGPAAAYDVCMQQKGWFLIEEPVQ